MNAKEQLRKKFSENPDKFYNVQLFAEKGFDRKKCKNCGSFFWTLDKERVTCPNPPCESYGFIGKPLNSKLDYVETWKQIEKFFVKNGHESIKSYPVVCRWFPGLYFTVASIVAFQRSLSGKTVFEMPANPLIIPQSCMRFNDIPNVGVTGRHFTNFTMVGQHSIYDGKNGYWKDKCIELDFELLTKIFHIPEKEINFMEDVWVGPNAFGYSLEYYYKGLELGNAVFTEFVGTPENYRQMDQKIIDMGAGLARFAWINQGSPTAYDAVFGPVSEKMLGGIDYDKDVWKKYCSISGNFNMEDFKNYRAAKQKAAGLLEMDVDELIRIISPVEAVYAVADHARSLLFALADGGLPSNVGGGYNLRVILRRALSFIDEFNLDIDMFELCKMHAKYLGDFNPRLKKSVDSLEDILEVEKGRYKTTRKKGEAIISSMIQKNERFDTGKLTELYESNGITPETIEKIAGKSRIKIDIPSDFYDVLSEKHMKERVENETKLDLEGVPETHLLFYDEGPKDFEACVIKIIQNKYVVLDQTGFYGKSGGQQGDAGFMAGCRVIDTEKYGNVIVHIVDNVNFSEGSLVKCEIDWSRRTQLMQHHTAVHLIHGAAHTVLGNHIWQAGANKTLEKAHLDITHYKQLSEQEIQEIENIANEMVEKNIQIKKFTMQRQKAEEKYGFVLYQGGVVPHKELRIIEIPGKTGIFDVEACGGTHCSTTKEVNKIIITSTERIQDGIVRINILAGKAAEKFSLEQKEILERISKILETKPTHILEDAKKIFEEWKSAKKLLEKGVERESKNIVEKLENSFVSNILIAEIADADIKTLQAISKSISRDERIIILFGVSDKIYVFGSAGKNTSFDIGKIVKNACTELDGNGGGTRILAQGVGFNRNKLENVIKNLEAMLHG